MGELDRDLASLICSPSLLQTFSDTDLMDALRRGCNDALAVLFERHSALVFRIARAILRDDGEAEETVQRVFLDVFRAVNQFNPARGSFKTWLLPQEVACLVEQVLSLLEPRQRKVIELTYFEGLTAGEVAKATGNTASSVRNNLYRGLSKLRNAVLENHKSRANSVSERSASAKGMLVEQPRTF